MAERGLTVGRVVIVGVGVAAVLALGFLMGYAARGEPKHTATEQLQAAQIGNVTAGRQVFSDYRCVACHSYRGVGGKDAPPLDYMRGHMAARDIADMSGRIWNHLPQMVKFFREEGIEVPTFAGSQMADLIAYLHAGGQAPEMPKGGNMGEEKGGDHMDEGKSGKGDHMDKGKEKQGGSMEGGKGGM